MSIHSAFFIATLAELAERQKQDRLNKIEKGPWCNQNPFLFYVGDERLELPTPSV